MGPGSESQRDQNNMKIIFPLPVRVSGEFLKKAGNRMRVLTFINMEMHKTPINMTEEIYSRAEVAGILGVHPLTIRNYEKSGKITPIFYIGHFPRYSLESITKLLTEKQTKPTQKTAENA